MTNQLGSILFKLQDINEETQAVAM